MDCLVTSRVESRRRSCEDVDADRSGDANLWCEKGYFVATRICSKRSR